MRVAGIHAHKLLAGDKHLKLAAAVTCHHQKVLPKGLDKASTKTLAPRYPFQLPDHVSATLGFPLKQGEDFLPISFSLSPFPF